MPYYNQYAYLDGEVYENPLSALWQLCTRSDVFTLRMEIQSLLKSAMGGESWRDDDPTEKSTHVWYAETITMLVETAFLINELCEKKEIIYSRKFKPKPNV